MSYCLCSENKGTDQLRGNRSADLRLCFSHMPNAGFLMTRLILKITLNFTLFCFTRGCDSVGTIRTKTLPSNPKREITKVTNSQNTKRTYGQPTEQLLPKRWQLSNLNQTKNDMNKHENHNRTTALERTVFN